MKFFIFALMLCCLGSVMAQEISENKEDLRQHSTESEPVPLNFDAESVGLQATGPSLVWSLIKKSGFVVGGENFRGLDYSFEVAPISANSFNVLFKFNRELFPQSTLYLYNARGNIVAQDLVETDQSRISRSYYKDEVGFKGSGFKACLYSEYKDSRNLACSPNFDEHFKLQIPPPKMVINGQAQSIQGSIDFVGIDSVDLTWVSENGLSFHHQGKTPKTQFDQIWQNDSKTLSLITHGTAPISDTKKISPERSAFWQNSLGDLRVFSETQVSKSTGIVAVRDTGGLIYTYELKYKDLPDQKSRLFLEPKSPHSTYASTLTLSGKKPKSTELSSHEFLVKSNYDGEEFAWTYTSSKMFEFNVSKLTAETLVENKVHTDVFSYEVMRMPSTYVFLGLGISAAGDGNIATFYDLHATQWFNEPFGNSYYWSRTRWGLTAGLYSSLSASVSNDQLGVGNLDLIYRLNPGVESWDEGLGITWGATQIAFSTVRTLSLFGPGVYWTRSLPEWFNSVLGISSFFRKPKWVDISAHYYLLSPDTNLTGSCFQIRALARIDITQNAYFEAGWGILSETSVDNSAHQMVKLTAARGYLGYGYRF